MMDINFWQTVTGVIGSALGGAFLTFFFMPKRDLVKMLFTRVENLEVRLDKKDEAALLQERRIGELTQAVEQCKELHKK